MRGRSLADQVREAAEALGVLGELALVLKGGPLPEVKTAFDEFIARAEVRHRELVQECHPDRPGGGDLERMQRANAARDLLRKIELNPRRRPPPQSVPLRPGMRVTVMYSYGPYSTGLHGVPDGFWERGARSPATGSAEWWAARRGAGRDSTGED